MVKAGAPLSLWKGPDASQSDVRKCDFGELPKMRRFALATVIVLIAGFLITGCGYPASIEVKELSSNGAQLSSVLTRVQLSVCAYPPG